ncbi:tetraspanin-33-like [Dysidea avara]|uniref:tetraspanin-33-like n=1 Tax=Dysidea avara TaxID=196820 RepID=UPI00331A332B
MTSESQWGNLLIKYLLFVVNLLIWILGGALLAIGIIAELQKEDYGDVSSSVLASPAIACMTIGSVLFVLGLLGCLGALVEMYYALMLYAILLSILLLAEMGIVIFVFIRRDDSEELVREQLEELIVEYRNNPDLQNLIDDIQSDLLECCGIDGPDDWQLNPYFNCSSPSLQACSVPFSCCLPEENSTTVNTQCGDGVLEPGNRGNLPNVIYTNGCYEEFEELINDLLPALAGIVLGVIVLELVNIFLSIGLALDIHRERKRAKEWRKLHPKQPKENRKNKRKDHQDSRF